MEKTGVPTHKWEMKQIVPVGTANYEQSTKESNI